MENRNFHTSMLGGFRKKDVIAFLAEEKLQHERELQDLQRLPRFCFRCRCDNSR